LHRGLFKGNRVWSFGVFLVDDVLAFDTRVGEPVALFDSRRIKIGGVHPRDQADPFLIEHNGSLFVFYEELLPGGVGTIACARTDDLKSFERLGVMLAEPHHLSYPFVFRDGEEILLLPEAKQSGEVSLYAFDRFPFEPRKLRALVSGGYVDCFLLNTDGLWYLFGTSAAGLEIFVSDDLRGGSFEPHPMNPVVTDPRFSRNGGGPLTIAGSTVRVAQDCSQSYGDNVSLIRIDELSPATYRETVVRTRFFEKDKRWNRLGAHHISVASFLGRTVLAADGESRDYVVNKLLSRLPR